MEHLPAFGTAIREQIAPTLGVYEPFLLKKASAIRSTQQKTASYGPHERQSLDVYYPTQTSATSPVLIFFHGGGFVWGGKTMERPDGGIFAEGLVYANLGHFFAEKHGFITLVANYRLDRHEARFPSGGEDFSLAIKWAEDNLATESSRDLYLMGNSAGAVHGATYLFHPNFAKQVEQLSKPKAAGTFGLVLKGFVSLSGPWSLATVLPYRAEVLNRYFLNDIPGNMPQGLLRKAIENGDPLAPGVRLLIADCEYDSPEEIIVASTEAVNLVKTIRPCDTLRIPGHNHVSPVMALGTGLEKDEAWANTVAHWCKM